jgi:hypothetical protein
MYHLTAMHKENSNQMATWILVQITGSELERFADLSGIEFDLRTVLRILKCSESRHHEFDLLAVEESLSVAALVRYVRCFASGKRWHLPGSIFKDSPEGMEESHNYFMEFRNKRRKHQ